jgi:hypothetical protein
MQHVLSRRAGRTKGYAYHGRILYDMWEYREGTTILPGFPSFRVENRVRVISCCGIREELRLIGRFKVIVAGDCQ